MNDQERKSKVTLEGLLQIKRSERPTAEFWNGFEQELRKKQLSALVHPVRPWWHRLAGRRLVARVYAPMGAAAAVAISFVAFERGSVEPVALAQINSSVIQRPVEVASVSASANETSFEQPATVAAVAQTELPVVVHESKHEMAIEPVDASSSTAPEQLLLAGTATMRAAGHALAQMVGLSDEALGSEAATRGDVVEPLTQLSTPRDSRRARLLAYSVAYDPRAAHSKDVAGSRERITRRMSDESVYDSISRLGVSGDRVSIKF